MRRNGTHGGKNQKKVSEYYSNNFYVTTSGHFHSKAMIDSMSEIGVDRVMFSIDYPNEYTEPATTWFDNAPIAKNGRIKIGRENTHRLLKLA